ncbi:MFS transporter [Marininema halotolerans]|uniref:MFS transporter, DHA3 family, tetracycline resistance protein n=1 Tax=Marininema halotolerans TaxID=1155944 RepID=A0A1I6Q0Y8_9BACL|nr:MFS transporter [Marininema halotolerans]SFS45988.1 MFS transporter, DHA3 family, tetracycline resistance protein [Marininema halotolerans]
MPRFSAYPMYLFYTGIGAFAFSLMSTATVLYFIKAVDLGPTQLLLVGFVLEITVFLFEIPTGIVADLYSRRLSMAIGFFLMGCAFLLTSLFPLLLTILISQVLWGIGYTFQSGADRAWIADEMKTASMESIYLRGAQIGQVAAFLGIGVSILFAQLSLAFPIGIAGGLLIITSLVIQAFFPETGFQPQSRQQKSLWQGMMGTFTEGVKTVRHHSLLTIMLIMSLFMGLYGEGFDRLWQKHLLDSFTLPLFGQSGEILWFGGLNAVSLLLNILVVEWLRRQLQRTGKLTKGWVLLVIHLLLMGTILLFAWTVSLPFALAAYCSTFILRGVNQPLFTAWLNESIHTPHLRATLFSMQGQLASFGEVIGGPLVMLVLFLSGGDSEVAGLTTSAFLLLPICFLLLLALRSKVVKYPSASDHTMTNDSAQL